VPLLQWVWLKRRPSAPAWTGIALAFAGTVLLADPGALDAGFGLGETLTVLAALAIGFEILLLARYAQGCNPVRFAFVQMTVVSLFCVAVATARGEGPPVLHPTFVVLIVTLAAVSALIQFAMSWAQQVVPATRATLIYSLEPVWAGLVGALAGERLGWLGLAGGALIVLGLVVTSLRPDTAEHPA
jgi:drug/metabolite transporter (DMT)-like permease